MAGPGLHPRYLILDGVRGAAAVSVVLHHIGQTTDRHSIFDYGWLAVDVFFLMSGYVMGGAYERRLAASPSPVLDMLRIRLLRLWPMVAVGAVLGLLAAPITNPGLHGWPLASAFLRQLAFAPTFTPAPKLFLLNVLEWSLFFELLINLLHAAVLRRLGVRGLAAIVVLGGVGLAASIAVFGTIDGGYDLRTLWVGFARVLFAYPLGLLAWRIGLEPPNVKGLLARVCEAAGEISYPLYSVQGPVLWLWWTHVVRRLPAPWEKEVAWLAFTPLICAFSYGLAKGFDAPVRLRLSTAPIFRLRRTAEAN